MQNVSIVLKRFPVVLMCTITIVFSFAQTSSIYCAYCELSLLLTRQCLYIP